MKRKVMLIDVALCHDCNNCFLACKDEHCGNEWPMQCPQPKHGHRWMDILRRERGQFPMIDLAFLPRPCMQCDDAPCVAVGGGAVRQRADGIVAIDPAKAAGKAELCESCSYGAIYWNAEENVPQKCDFCAHLLDEGEKTPRCVAACPTGALLFREVDESGYAALLKAGYQVYGSASSASVLYKNLDRFEKHFLGGSVVKGGECAENVEVTLSQGGSVLSRKRTNAFGDFKFDGLNTGSYTVSAGGKETAVKLDGSLYIGDIEL